MKKFNDKGAKIADWTTKKLKQEAKRCDELIYKVECYGTRDMIMLDRILVELENRNVKVRAELVFDED